MNKGVQNRVNFGLLSEGIFISSSPHRVGNSLIPSGVQVL